MAHSKIGDPSECQNPFIFIFKELGLNNQLNDNIEIVASRELHFYDTSDGKILITDKNGVSISVVGGEGGFMSS